jgi:hypothetical protein
LGLGEGGTGDGQGAGAEQGDTQVTGVGTH